MAHGIVGFMKKTLLNRDVAESLDLSESGVSRLRSGSRFPSLAVMQSIESAYGWSVQDQSDALQERTWTEGLEGVISAHAEKIPEATLSD